MSDILKVLSDKFDEDLERYKDDIARGTAKDFGAYQYGCGIYHGLLMAKNHIIELAERLREDL